MIPDELDDIQFSDPYCDKELPEEQAIEDDRDYARRNWGAQRQAHQAKGRGNRRDVRPLYHARHEQGRNGSRLDRRG